MAASLEPIGHLDLALLEQLAELEGLGVDRRAAGVGDRAGALGRGVDRAGVLGLVAVAVAVRVGLDVGGDVDHRRGGRGRTQGQGRIERRVADRVEPDDRVQRRADPGADRRLAAAVDAESLAARDLDAGLELDSRPGPAVCGSSATVVNVLPPAGRKSFSLVGLGVAAGSRLTAQAVRIPPPVGTAVRGNGRCRPRTA